MAGAVGTGKCALAKVHVPGQPNPDQHHVLPRAFQAFWHPDMSAQERSGWSAAPVYAALAGVPTLWDPRTVTVCPNHHRLVHQAIVAMMRAGTTETPAEAFKAAFGNYRTTSVRQTAYLALTRWVEAGGSLNALRAAKLLGEQ